MLHAKNDYKYKKFSNNNSQLQTEDDDDGIATFLKIPKHNAQQNYCNSWNLANILNLTQTKTFARTKTTSSLKISHWKISICSGEQKL